MEVTPFSWPGVTPEKKSLFWKGIVRAVEAEPREVTSVHGASGLVHPVVALGADEQRKRVVIISGEPDGRSAAMAAADIQAKLTGYQVIMARPAAVNLAPLAKKLAQRIGHSLINQADMKWFSEAGESVQQQWIKTLIEGDLATIFKPFFFAPLNLIAAWQEIIQQIALICLRQNNMWIAESLGETLRTAVNGVSTSIMLPHLRNTNMPL